MTTYLPPNEKLGLAGQTRERVGGYFHHLL